jgi:H+/gluconate symporter-like permease
VFKKKQALEAVSIAITCFFIGSMFNVMANDSGGNPWDKVWAELSGLEFSLEALEAKVFVDWHLPLFGLVTMHYTWVSIIQTIVTATIIAVIITVLVFLYRKRARQVQREYEYQTR